MITSCLRVILISYWDFSQDPPPIWFTLESKTTRNFYWKQRSESKRSCFSMCQVKRSPTCVVVGMKSMKSVNQPQSPIFNHKVYVCFGTGNFWEIVKAMASLWCFLRNPFLYLSFFLICAKPGCILVNSLPFIDNSLSSPLFTLSCYKRTFLIFKNMCM